MRLKAILATAVLGVSLSVSADHHEEGKLDLHAIMKDGHKGRTSLAAKAKKGEATQDELKILIGMYLAMEKLEPHKGDAASWKEKTTKLTAAAINVFAKTEGSLDAYSKAVNCKACHDVHKED